MKKILIAIILTPFIANAQYEMSSFTSTGRGGATTFATDYQTLGINPANLGWDMKFSKKKFALGFNEITYSIYSEALKKDELRQTIKDNLKSGGKDFTYAEKLDAAKQFTDAGLALNLDFGAIGFAFMDQKFGGIAFRTNDRIQWYSKLGETASNLLFMGKTSSIFDSLHIINSLGDTAIIANNADSISSLDPNQIIDGFASAPKLLSQIMKGSEITLAWTREWNVSYGKRLFGDSTFAMFAGIGFKYIQGIAMMDIRDNNGKLEAFSSISPVFGIDYGSAATLANKVTQSGFMPKPVGKGYGIDFGLNVVIKNKIKLGAALINMGSVTWDGNVYTIKDTQLVSTNSGGLESYNFFGQMDKIIGKEGIFNLEGTSKKVVKLPSVLRLGGSIKFGKKVELGVDAIMPFNDVSGSYQKGLFGFGGDVSPVKWLRLSAGFMTGGNYDFQIPLGLTIIAKNGTYECGIASRDAVTFFSQNGPTLSLSTGFMRFRF